MILARKLLVFLIPIIIVACANVNRAYQHDGLRINHSYDTVTNNISPERTIINFLKWYKNNEARLHQIPVLSGGLGNPTSFYRVDFKASELYLSELKKSGFLSDKFLNDLRQFFIKSDEYLKIHPQNDGPAPGFEADLVMKSQDYMDVWANLNKAKMIQKEIKEDKALIVLLFAGNYKNKYNLSRSGNTWLLDAIE